MDTKFYLEQCYVDGRWVDAQDRATFEVINPSTGLLIGAVPDMGAIDARLAIEGAQRAFEDWRLRTAGERADALLKWRELILRDKENLAHVMTVEQGKPLEESRGEIGITAAFLRWFAEEARRVYGDTVPSHAFDKRLLVTKEPVGVVAAITPWNFPSGMIGRKAGAALAAGCPVVLKPAPDTPYSALALARLSHEAGIPPGVFNVVTSSKKRTPDVGREMTGNPLVRKITFTGSTATGKTLLRQAADSIKRVTLELGGNAPFIVFEDADLELATDEAIYAKYRNSGQTCISVNRFLVQDSIYERFVELLAQRSEALRVGDGFEEGVDQGPLINEQAVAKVMDHIEDARNHGATVVTGGARSSCGGTFFVPTVIRDVTPEMKICREEVFGPIAAIVRFRDEAEAIRLANATNYGLAAYFFSENARRIWRVSEALEYGMISINTGSFATEVAPFGGYKESGLGREGSKYGLDDYLEIKYCCHGGIGRD